MRVLITGATGYIGSAVASALKRAGQQVLALVRKAEQVDRMRALGYEAVLGDLQKPETFTMYLERCDAVVHAAFDYQQNGPAADQAAIEAIVRTHHSPFIYTSGVWVLGNTGGKLTDERTPLKPLDIVAWRPAVEKLAIRHPMGMVVRPGCVYGGQGGLVGRMWQEAKAGAVSIVGDGTNRWSKVHREDLADLYLKLLDKRPLQQIYHATDGDESTMQQVAQAIVKGGAVTRVPLEQAREKMGSFADALAVDQRVSSDKARRELQWWPKYSFLRDIEKLRAESSS
jgi:nucleoside-diphosphate-sugar epimerase